MKKIIIIGAGLAGLSAAWHLQKKGIDCRVFEKESEVGGLCRSKKINGFTLDYDGHLLHFRHGYTFNLIKSLLKNNLVRHDRKSWVYFDGVYTPYPFQANLFGLPAAVIKECLAGFFEAKGKKHVVSQTRQNFSDWIYQTFGRGIARNFMVPYNTKFWTIKPEKLTCEWLDGFIPVPSGGQVVEGAVEENRIQFGYNVRFWYPKKGGIGEVPLAFARQIKGIQTSCNITEIDQKRKTLKINSGNRERFDYLISTAPLPEMGRLIRVLPLGVKSALGRLKWNSIFNLNIGLNNDGYSQRHWIYFPQKEISFFRIGFPHNFSSEVIPSGKGALYAEVAYSKNKPLDIKRIPSIIKQDLKKTGIIRHSRDICIEDINDIKYGYPIYDFNYTRARGKVIKYLTSNNIIPCGRYGSWRYFSMEEAILEGRRAAEVLIL